MAEYRGHDPAAPVGWSGCRQTDPDDNARPRRRGEACLTTHERRQTSGPAQRSGRFAVGAWSHRVAFATPRSSSRAKRSSRWLAPDDVPATCPVENAQDRVILPGLVDAHVHINEPGRTEWEGFETATRAAAAGGITSLFDMPLNSSPVTTTSEALDLKLKSARGKLWVDCGFYGGIVPGVCGQIGALAAKGVAGFKAFLCHSGIDEFPNAGESELRAAMPELARAGLPLLVHAELTGPAQSGGASVRSRSSQLRPLSRVATARVGA